MKIPAESCIGNVEDKADFSTFYIINFLIQFSVLYRKFHFSYFQSDIIFEFTIFLILLIFRVYVF